MKTKNHEIYLSAYTHLWRWALLLDFDIESSGKEYKEINLSILCFTFSLVSISKAYQTKLDKMYNTLKNEQKT